MKITLIHPPQLNVLDNRQDPPLGLLYIASILMNQGHETDVVDLGGMDEKYWDEMIGGADVFGITCYTPTFSYTRRIAALIKARYPDGKIVVGGAHPSALPESTISQPGFDFVVRGEGETAVLEVLRLLETGRTGLVVHGEPIMDLDSVPFPARDLVDIFGYSRTVTGRKATNMITGRGCPYRCSFCYKGVHGQKFRLRSARNVIEEAESIIDRYGIRAFHFLDDIFTINRARLATILDAFASMDVVFRCNSRVDLQSVGDFESLYRGGCREIAFGIESGSQKILDGINKGNTVEQNKQAILNAKRAGIGTKAYFIVGLPGETAETIDETERFIEETLPDAYSIYTFVPYPGTPIWQDPESFGIEIVDNDFDNYYMINREGRGGITFRLDTIPMTRLAELREELMERVKELYEGDKA